jgi:hypothetical protein
MEVREFAGGLEQRTRRIPRMSQLLDRFKAAVNAFNSVQNKGDYTRNLTPFLDQSVKMNQVDDNTKAHTPRSEVLSYLESTQIDKLPRFNPDYNSSTEDPKNSDSATSASIDGPGSYTDISKIGSATTPFPVNYHFEFHRASTADSWLITVAYAHKT